MQLALFEPDIPQNVGAMLRLGACFAAPLHIIEPCGFAYDERRIKRVAMDYAELAHVRRHDSWGAFCDFRAAQLPASRLILLSTKGAQSLYDFAFRPADILLVGRESSGVPQPIHAAADAVLRIPMAGDARSLNVVTAAAIALAEAQRQLF